MCPCPQSVWSAQECCSTSTPLTSPSRSTHWHAPIRVSRDPPECPPAQHCAAAHARPAPADGAAPPRGLTPRARAGGRALAQWVEDDRIMFQGAAYLAGDRYTQRWEPCSLRLHPRDDRSGASGRGARVRPRERTGFRPPTTRRGRCCAAPPAQPRRRPSARGAHQLTHRPAPAPPPPPPATAPRSGDRSARPSRRRGAGQGARRRRRPRAVRRGESTDRRCGRARRNLARRCIGHAAAHCP